jgi:UDP-glucose 4-epimerase
MISDTFEISRESVYNLGSGLSYSVNDIIYEISSVVKKPVQIDYKPMRNTDIKNVTLDMSRFKNEFKIEPGTNLREGIFHTWDYVSSLTS